MPAYFGYVTLVSRDGNALNESFAGTLADIISHFIQVITPNIEDIENEPNNEEDAR